MACPFFNTDERISRLREIATRWKGTPWCANSEARGLRGGVSCHNLPRAIYVECGALPTGFPRVTADPNGTRHKKRGVMEPYLDSRTEFRRLNEGQPLMPGDLLGLRIYYCLDHLGVFLGTLDEGARFVHVLAHKTTCFDIIDVSPWSERLLAAWRPLEA